MQMPNRGELRCMLIALLYAWVIMIFVPSALIALFGFSDAVNPGYTEMSRLPAATFEVADEVGPAAKLLMIACFTVLVLMGERLDPARGRKRQALNVVLGLGAMLLALGFIPEALSRGFGIGLTGARFDPRVLPIYLTGGALGGVVFTASVTRCRVKDSRTG